ncbi:WD40-repeat-containing domain protein [Radiomyces spectabilis]|uniref:WD40-repeat-containing domain protein n=1 Tax=Radiomyces spectabilis TaxID=64574 RepID=UPI002220582B|nr:WD40-repeat-containing domain protein [Radiomyces spectabilis]KAI8365329.1 WD40-repeat-containing domain protein [Radiomyces spectabilis]
MTETSCVYGLRHQARCLTAVTASNEKSQFLVGTVGVKNNIVCLLEYDDESNEVIPTMYEHADEVWDISVCPTNQDRFFTSHSPVSGNPSHKKATLWQKYPENASLTELVTLEPTGVQRVLWDPQRDQSQVALISGTNIYHISLEASHHQASTVLSIDASSMFQRDRNGAGFNRLQNAVWNPHQPEIIAVGDCCVAGWDLRSGDRTFMRNDAHKGTIRAVDYNTNQPYHLVTGGDDGLVHIWDVRQLDQPVLDIQGHTHWVWSVALNKFHDQLLLSSGSDTLVNLHNAVSVSSASYMGNETSDTEERNIADHPSSSGRSSDGLIYTYDQHEDSVYSIAWSQADTWTFASLSYAGRVIISQVPTSEKFKILGV